MKKLSLLCIKNSSRRDSMFGTFDRPRKRVTRTLARVSVLNIGLSRKIYCISVSIHSTTTCTISSNCLSGFHERLGKVNWLIWVEVPVWMFCLQSNLFVRMWYDFSSFLSSRRNFCRTHPLPWVSLCFNLNGPIVIVRVQSLHLTTRSSNVKCCPLLVLFCFKAL